jgi:mono/diheme cytochrome c family protein
MRTLGQAKVMFGILFVVVTCAGSAATAAETDNPGKAMYLKYCGACHGPGGKGDGVVSGFMRPKPTDLTKIAPKAEFPFMRVADSIDGTKPVGAHGDAQMPVWGELFRAESAPQLTRQAEVRGKLMLITEYVRSIQEK